MTPLRVAVAGCGAAGSQSSAHGRVAKRSYIAFMPGMNPGMTANGGPSNDA